MCKKVSYNEIFTRLYFVAYIGFSFQPIADQSVTYCFGVVRFLAWIDIRPVAKSVAKRKPGGGRLVELLSGSTIPLSYSKFSAAIVLCYIFSH